MVENQEFNEPGINELKEVYKLLFEKMLDGSAYHRLILDKEGNPADYKFLQINPAFTTITGLGKEIIGKTVKEVLPGIENHWIEYYGKVALEGEPLFFESFSPFFNKYFKVYAFSPKKEEFICVFSDITESKEAEKELKKRRKQQSLLEKQLLQAEKMEAVGRLAGGIAHDFNNILTSIMGYADLCLYDASQGSILYQNLESILKSAKRAQDLSSHLLSFSKISTTSGLRLYISFVMPEIISQIENSLPFSVKLRSAIYKNIGPIELGEEQLCEMIVNLCSNAAWFMDDNGFIDISCYAEKIEVSIEGILGDISPGSYAVIEVKDSGCGIDPGKFHKIFEPFYTTKKVGQGKGMGLAVVYGTVKRYGGNILIKSQSGEGATFKLYFPIIEQSTKDESKFLKKEIHEKIHIMMVDDEDTLCKMASQILKNEGYIVSTFIDPKAALQAYIAEPNLYDLVITDYKMPQMSGTQLASEIIAINPYCVIVLCTGYYSEDEQKQALEVGIKDILIKPFRKNDLLEKLNTIIQKHFQL